VIYISHRGNLNSVNADRENSLSYIDECLNSGFHCEIDLRMKNGLPHLGHDYAQYPVSNAWLHQRKDCLWIHVKEYEALVWLTEESEIPEPMYFCHESDKYTLTSNGYIWSHDLRNKMTGKCIVPLLSLESVYNYNHSGFYAVCSDFVEECKRTWG
jgi:hypothetical protein